IQCGHAAKTGRGNGLTVDMVGDITGSKYTWHAGLGSVAFGTTVDADITVFHLQLACKNVGVRLVANRHKHAVHINFLLAAVNRADNFNAGYSHVITQHFIQSVVPDDGDIATFSLGKQFVLQDFFCAQAVTTVNQCDMGSDIGQIQCFFNSGIAAADDCDRLVAVEETVTGGAGADAAAHKCLLGRQSQILGGSTSSNDQRITGVLTAITLEVEGALLQIDLVDMVKNDLGV